MRPISRFIVVGTAFVLGIVICLVLSDWLSVDKCLDNGGRWNEELSLCERVVPQP